MAGGDNGYSIAERMKFAGHFDPNTFVTSYMSQLSTVDGQGSFFGQELRRDHLEDFRGLSLHRHPQLWQSLPAKHRFELERRPEFIAVDKEIETLAWKLENASDAEETQPYQVRRQELYERRRQLTVDELRKCQKLQPKKLTSQTANEPCLEDHRRTFFASTRGLMPERDRLASCLFKPVTLRSAEGRTALHDLISLCTRDSRVVYRPGLRPKEGRCPSPECSLDMNRSVASSIPTPITVKRKMADRLSLSLSFE